MQTRCPQCHRPHAEVYEGEQAYKLNTVFCDVCGRVPLPAPEPEKEVPPAAEATQVEEAETADPAPDAEQEGNEEAGPTEAETEEAETPSEEAEEERPRRGHRGH